ncbi:MAG: PLP-dependent aminotransferase family protein [Anaerolineales bacterium]|nr:PLP-dependent aminotransferase family protein [Anaerolineales bacterium]
MGNRAAGPSRRGAPLYERVAENIAHLVETGTFRPGDRIPSVRQLSQQKRISVTTVLQAYYLLEDQGLIEARPQSGYYVRTQLPSGLPEPEISSPEPDPSQVSIHELTMMVLRDAENPNLAQFGTAVPNPELVPTRKLNSIMASLARRNEPRSNQYVFPPGCEALRVQIAQRAVNAGCSLSPNDIVITSGCIEAIDLCLRAVCHRGDTVAIESPMYFGILQLMESLGVQALEIPTHPREGISLEALRFAVEHTPVKACLVVPNFNNPLGSCMPDEKKKELVELLARYDLPLIENDISGELYHSGKRPIVSKAYDRKGLVMLCSSFSKEIAPGYRVGWVAPGRLKPTVEWLKFTANIATATLPQLAIAGFLESGGYDHHLRHIRRVYARYVAQMSLAIIRHFPKETRITRPTGGFVLWVQLPERVDSLVLYRQALKAGITLTPGYIFSATNQYRNFIRLNAAFWSAEAERAIERLGEIIKKIA